MNAGFCLKTERIVTTKMKNKTKCIICKNTVFRVERITPELVMMTCETCGEPHMIGANSDTNGTHLTFWGSESDDID